MITANLMTNKNRAGFTLVEIILVLVITGILAVAVGPFVGRVLTNIIEVRQFSERERQATHALERFVRDVRMSEVTNAGITGDSLELVNGDTLIYQITEDTLLLSRKGEDPNVLARHIAPGSRFEIFDINNDYEMVTMILKIQINAGRSIEFSAAAVPRSTIR